MSRTRKFAIMGICATLIGCVIIIKYSDWQIIIALFFMMWGQNIDRAIARKEL